MDDAQEWGRKRISELYVNKDSSYEFCSIVPSFDVHESQHRDETIKIHSFKAKKKNSTCPDDIYLYTYEMPQLLIFHDEYKIAVLPPVQTDSPH